MVFRGNGRDAFSQEGVQGPRLPVGLSERFQGKKEEPRLKKDPGDVLTSKGLQRPVERISVQEVSIVPLTQLHRCCFSSS